MPTMPTQAELLADLRAALEADPKISQITQQRAETRDMLAKLQARREQYAADIETVKREINSLESHRLNRLSKAEDPSQVEERILQTRGRLSSLEEWLKNTEAYIKRNEADLKRIEANLGEAMRAAIGRHQTGIEELFRPMLMAVVELAESWKAAKAELADQWDMEGVECLPQGIRLSELLPDNKGLAFRPAHTMSFFAF
ncbi:MAG: hypothetical protein V1797_17175 [Pseudomonadota bacterium]